MLVDRGDHVVVRNIVLHQIIHATSAGKWKHVDLLTGATKRIFGGNMLLFAPVQAVANRIVLGLGGRRARIPGEKNFVMTGI